LLKSKGLVPPNMMDLDEDKMREEYEAAMEPPYEVDHAEDKTAFEIGLINKRDHGVVFDCGVRNGDILFNHVTSVKEGGSAYMKVGLGGRRKLVEQYVGPKFQYMNEVSECGKQV